MEIRNIITFVKAAEMKSFTKTASQLGYSQAAVTVQIKQLEDELGTQLFDRIGRSVSLTRAGEKFMPYALQLLKSMDDAVSFMKKEDEPSGVLRIGASSSFSAGMIPKLIPEFCEKYPKIEIIIRTSDLLASMLELLRQNQLDFVFTLERQPHIQDCELVAAHSESFAFVTSPDNPLASMKNVPIEKIVENNFISADREVSYGLYLEQTLMERGIPFHPMVEIGSTSAIISILAKGVGVSFLPVFLTEEPVKKGELAFIDTENLGIQAWTQMMRLKNKWVNAEMQAFIDFVSEKFRNM